MVISIFCSTDLLETVDDVVDLDGLWFHWLELHVLHIPVLVTHFFIRKVCGRFFACVGSVTHIGHMC